MREGKITEDNLGVSLSFVANCILCGNKETGNYDSIDYSLDKEFLAIDFIARLEKSGWGIICLERCAIEALACPRCIARGVNMRLEQEPKLYPHDQAYSLAQELDETLEKTHVPMYDRLVLQRLQAMAWEVYEDVRQLEIKAWNISMPISKSDKMLDLGNDVKLEMVMIPAGEFMMGSDNSTSDETPVHKVEITEPFYMSKYEVTQRQYEKIMGTNPSRFQGAMNPVENVSWDDAQEFCKKVSQKVGQTVTLPTEAQWEYACRAGSTSRFSFGDNDNGLGDYAWYCANSGNTTHPVGQKKPNAWGLFDMIGNVWEWCQDWYGTYSDETQTDPSGPAAGSTRVCRGGSWYNPPYSCRAAYRLYYVSAPRGNRYGFRVVVSKTLEESFDLYFGEFCTVESTSLE